MKLPLIASLLLLVPLAFAEAKPYAKLLYDGGYVIAEGYDARKIDYYYQESWDGGYLVLSSQDNHTDSGMFLNRSLIKQSPGFAVEISEDGHRLDLDYCMKHSDEKLKYLIVSCGGTTILRALTEEERAQIQQYKKEQQVSKKPFEVIFSESRVKIKSGEIRKVSFEDIIGHKRYRNLFFNATINPGEESHEMYVMAKPSGRTLVIESLPVESKEACGKIGLEDLFLADCKGKIQIRSN